MIKAGIVGATGYAGIELVRLLSQHPSVTLTHLGSQTYDQKPYIDTVSSFRGKLDDYVCRNAPVEELADSCDVLFLALPHGIASRQINEKVLEKTCIIDLGADFRLKDVKIYEKWYGIPHSSPHLLPRAVYGLSEFERSSVSKTNLIANPGCYTTCSILTLAPLIRTGFLSGFTDSGGYPPILIDAKSGVSGAGRKAGTASHYCETNESIKAYKIASHRHTPEIEQYLEMNSDEPVRVQFTPHLVPMNRGILCTAYIPLGHTGKKTTSLDELRGLYLETYDNEFFVRILPEGIFPETRWVKGSNYIDIGIFFDERTNTIIAVGAIDNLVKGAAGQAIQNMNIRFGFEENEGLRSLPCFP